MLSDPGKTQTTTQHDKTMRLAIGMTTSVRVLKNMRRVFLVKFMTIDEGIDHPTL